MNPRTTIVTAFMTKINNIDFRSYNTYIDYGNKLLSLECPVVIFIEQAMFDLHYKDESHLYPNCRFVIFERYENYLYKHLQLVTKYEVTTNNPSKDTIGYMFVQCHKTEWLRKAIELNPFHTENFTWIDFGIYHMIKNDEILKESVGILATKLYPSVRIASCVDPREPCNVDIYHQVVWFFAGSIVGGNSETLLKFADIMKEFCINIIKEKNHIMWEVNIWYLIYKEYPEIFDFYPCDHNASILQNY